MGSDYGAYYYPSNIYRTEPGDQFTVYVDGATCSGAVDYSGNPVGCNLSPSPPPPTPTPTPPTPVPTPPTTGPRPACSAAQAADAKLGATEAGASSVETALGRLPVVTPATIVLPVASGQPVGLRSATAGTARSTGGYRVFSRGCDEIAVPTRRGLASAYYHLVIPASHPFPRGSPQTGLAPIVIDSRIRRVFLQFTSPRTILTGTFRATPIRVSSRGFSARLNIVLRRLSGGAPAGTLTYVIRARRATDQPAADGRGGGGPLTLSLSGGLDIYADVLGAAGDSSRLASVTATLPAVQKGGGGQRGQQLIGGTYKGSTSENEPFSIELTDDKTQIKHIDWSTPRFSCPGSFVSVVPEDRSIELTGPIAGNNTFLASGERTLTYANGLVAGYGTYLMSGAFTSISVIGGVSIQSVEGSATVTESVIEGPHVGLVCSHSAGFTASGVATNG